MITLLAPGSDESTTVIVENRSPQDIEAELRDKLGAIFGYDA